MIIECTIFVPLIRGLKGSLLCSNLIRKAFFFFQCSLDSVWKCSLRVQPMPVRKGLFAWKRSLLS